MLMDLYQQIFFSTFALAFSLLHFSFYFYSDKSRSNLYFALFLFTYAFSIFFDYQATLSTVPEKELIASRYEL